jgi:multiple antibiotic resistance protein
MNAELYSLIIAKAFTLFMVLDPLGNAGPVATLLSRYEMSKQQKILRREVIIALVAMLLFYMGGSYFLSALEISQAAVEITGGAVFMIVSISILFPRRKSQDAGVNEQEPFIVPIAIPLISGPSCLATVILFSHEAENTFATVCGMVLAWTGAAIIMLLAPYLVRTLGRNGLRAGEQMIGIVCALIAVKMILTGVNTFMGQ